MYPLQPNGCHGIDKLQVWCNPCLVYVTATEYVPYAFDTENIIFPALSDVSSLLVSCMCSYFPQGFRIRNLRNNGRLTGNQKPLSRIRRCSVRAYCIYYYCFIFHKFKCKSNFIS